jgi:metal transporter CNNM
MDILIWIGIGICILHSAMFSGLNLAVFSISRLRLEIEASNKNSGAQKALILRQDSNFTLTTILWGNVAVNTLLAILSNSVMIGILAFLFSTIVITFFGEIFPQAYFFRHALRMASMLYPVLRFYQILLYPFAKPTAILLNLIVGKEGIKFYAERDLREVIRKHMESRDTDIDHVEGMGALNFLSLDDLGIHQEGEILDHKSLINIRFDNGSPVFPPFDRSASDAFIQQVQDSEKKWVILTNDAGEPIYALDADGFLRAALLKKGELDPLMFCHKPVIITDPKLQLGSVLHKLKVYSEKHDDDVVDRDIILVWFESTKKIITGADILGRLLRGIALQVNYPYNTKAQ